MRVRKLGVDGAFEFRPDVHSDDRGLFVSLLEDEPFRSATRRSWFPLAQASLSRSRRGVVRGMHYTATPPGMATYVYCPHGRALDLCLDVRVGSPTFGCWDAVPLDPGEFRAVYLPVGVAHGFVALANDTAIAYALSGGYVPANELAVHPLDPGIGLPIPSGVDPILSERDRAAPTLAQARALGVLPDYRTCLKVADALWPATDEKG